MCVYAVYQARVLRHKITYNVNVMLGNRQKITNGNRNQLADGNINQNGDNLLLWWPGHRRRKSKPIGSKRKMLYPDIIYLSELCLKICAFNNRQLFLNKTETGKKRKNNLNSCP